VARLTAMPTPPMLRSRQPSDLVHAAPDPLVSVSVAAMTLVAIGLLLAGILAVYDWKTPGAEAPLVLWIAVIALATLAVDLLVVSVRYLRRLRLGL
jgi:hypothetical protein